MEARPPSFLQNTTSAEIPSTFHYGRVVCCYGQATPVEVNTSRYICPFSRASGEDHAAASRVVLPNCGIHRRECTPISWTAIIGTRHGKRSGPKKYGRKVDTLTNSPRSCLMTHMYMQIRRRDHPVPQFFSSYLPSLFFVTRRYMWHLTTVSYEYNQTAGMGGPDSESVGGKCVLRNPRQLPSI